MRAPRTPCETCVVTELRGDLGPRRNTGEFTVRRERAAVKARPERIDSGSARPSVAIDAIPSVDCTDHLRPMSQPLLTDKATTGGTKLDQAALKLAALDLEVATQSLFVAGQQRQYAEPCRGSSRIHRRRPGGCGAAGRVAAIEQA